MLSTKEHIGKLDRRITFQQNIIQKNESNEDEETGWENIASNPTVWAATRDVSGSEDFQADKLTELRTMEFIIRYRTDISLKYRISFAGELYNIISAAEIGRKGYLRLIGEMGIEYQETDGSGFSNGYSSGFS